MISHPVLTEDLPPGVMPSSCDLHLFTFGRKSLLRADLAAFPFEGSGCLAAAFGSSLGVGFAGLAAASPLISIFGGSGGGGGGMDIPLGAAGGSETSAVYSRQRENVKIKETFISI